MTVSLFRWMVAPCADLAAIIRPRVAFISETLWRMFRAPSPQTKRGPMGFHVAHQHFLSQPRLRPFTA
ncbi:hypothetical protein VTK56DRAFT_6152 [Thermocarpiscus australiensis]